MKYKTESIAFIEYIIDELSLLKSGFVRVQPIRPNHPNPSTDDPMYFPPSDIDSRDIPDIFMHRLLGKTEENRFRVTQISSVRPTDRHVVKRRPHARYIKLVMFERAEARNAKWSKLRLWHHAPVFGIAGGEVFDAADMDGFVVPDFGDYLKMCISAMLVSQWSNTIEIGVDGRSLTMLTDLDGARQALAMRDVPEGKKRRDALLHWVSQHWRAKPTGGKCSVKRHKRGTRKFTVMGPIWAKIEDTQ